MTDQELDTLMRRVLLDSLKLDAESTASGELAFEPTPRYQRQMAAMVKDPLKWERRRARPLWKNVAQKAAVILLVFSLSLGSLMAVSPTVRAAVVRWVTEWYETHVVYRFSGEQLSGEMPQYEITNLPEGYAEDVSKRIEWPEYISFTYHNSNEENDQGIIFDYTYMSQGGVADFVTEDSETISVTVNGMKAIVEYVGEESFEVVAPNVPVSYYEGEQVRCTLQLQVPAVWQDKEISVVLTNDGVPMNFKRDGTTCSFTCNPRQLSGVLEVEIKADGLLLYKSEVKMTFKKRFRCHLCHRDIEECRYRGKHPEVKKDICPKCHKERSKCVCGKGSVKIKACPTCGKDIKDCSWHGVHPDM